jgi:ribosomal subunit interface protein
MQIQFNYANFDASDALERHVEESLDHTVKRFADRLTRIEVHLADESSPNKRTPNDKKCLLEARPAGMKPISVDEHADDMYDAVKGAARKLERVLEKKLEKD